MNYADAPPAQGRGGRRDPRSDEIGVEVEKMWRRKGYGPLAPAGRVAAWLLGLWLALHALAAIAFEPPAFAGDVRDEAGVLDEAQRAMLAERIRAMRATDGVWAAVFVASGLQGESIEVAAVATFEKWKLGEAGRDNGLLVMVAPVERKMRIEVGYGLEGAITDALSKRVVDEIYKPAFRDGRYAEGLLQGFAVLAAAANPAAQSGAALPPPVPTPAPQSPMEIDWSRAGVLFFSTLLGNLAVVPLIGLGLRRRSKVGWANDRAAHGRIKSAWFVFGFLGVFFGLFQLVFGLAMAEDPEVFWGLLGMNGLFDLAFGLPMILAGRGSGSGRGGRSSFDNDSSGWSSGSGSSSSDSDSSSSSGGGSSGGGGASGSY